MPLAVRHVTSYAYTPPAERCAWRLRLYPSDFASQRVLSWSVRVNGAPVTPLLTNATGDRESIWTCNEAVADVEVVAEGEVEVSDTAGVIRGLREMMRPGVFLRQTPLTTADERIAELAGSVGAMSGLERLHALSAAVRDAIDYKPGATAAGVTAVQALKQGAGVCQDHAHVFIAAARSLNIPARYVVGYMLADDASHTETHAWAEAHAPDLGWVGFDPANRVCPTNRYVRLACGLDAVDAAPIRGSVGGAATQSLSASVDISQTQQ